MLSIITPTYNEAKNIRNLVLQVHTHLKEINYEFIVIDDNSPDGTGKIADALSGKYPLKVLHRRKRSGLASAVIEGFNISQGSLLCVMDADLSHPPEIIPKLIECMKEHSADIAVASRYIKDGGTENFSRARKVLSSLCILLTRPLTNVKDSMSGFFLLKKEVIDHVTLVPRGYKILLEILVKGKYKKIIEVPFTFKNRSAGSSKVTTRVCLEFLWQLMHLYTTKQ